MNTGECILPTGILKESKDELNKHPCEIGFTTQKLFPTTLTKRKRVRFVPSDEKPHLPRHPLDVTQLRRVLASILTRVDTLEQCLKDMQDDQQSDDDFDDAVPNLSYGTNCGDVDFTDLNDDMDDEGDDVVSSMPSLTRLSHETPTSLWDKANGNQATQPTTLATQSGGFLHLNNYPSVRPPSPLSTQQSGLQQQK